LIYSFSQESSVAVVTPIWRQTALKEVDKEWEQIHPYLHFFSKLSHRSVAKPMCVHSRATACPVKGHI
jgi:hypothetical protein